MAGGVFGHMHHVLKDMVEWAAGEGGGGTG
jgi:hypothetical protein